MNCALYQHHNHETDLDHNHETDLDHKVGHFLKPAHIKIIASQGGPCVLDRDLPAFVQRLPT